MVQGRRQREMHTAFILFIALLAFAFTGFPAQAKTCSSQVVTTNTRTASGRELSLSEMVTKERDGGTDSVETEGNGVEKERPELRRRFLRKRELSGKVECPSMKPPSNGYVVCNWSRSEPEAGKRCSAICIPNYKFADGSAKKTFNCTLQGDFWNQIDQISDCQPAKPGIGCDKDIDGRNQLRICIFFSEKMECKSTCNSGYKFPNGETETKILCTKSTGMYEPIEKFPDCVEGGGKDIKIPEKDETNEEAEKEKGEGREESEKDEDVEKEKGETGDEGKENSEKDEDVEKEKGETGDKEKENLEKDEE